MSPRRSEPAAPGREPAPSPGEITALLRRVAEGQASAATELYERLMPELRRLARAAMRGQPAGHSLQPTALVNEAYLRLFRLEGADWPSRGHFLAMAARAMRSVLVDHARHAGREKRGGAREDLSLEELGPGIEPVGVDLGVVDLLDLDAALTRFGAEYERELRVVELRCFAGLSSAEVARATGGSLRTVERDWRFAKAELRRLLDEGAS